LARRLTTALVFAGLEKKSGAHLECGASPQNKSGGKEMYSKVERHDETAGANTPCNDYAICLYFLFPHKRLFCPDYRLFRVEGFGAALA
jgi:hypothetical protein